MDDIINQLIGAGILQFGRFGDGEKYSPFRLNFAFLPSYPDLLRLLAKNTQKILEGLRADRLVCTGESLSFGLTVGLKTNIPVVYSKESGLPPTYDLIGAYDIGHPAVLLVNTLHDAPIAQLLPAARRVGIEIHTVIAILDLGNAPSFEIPHHCLLNLKEIINQLENEGHLPRGQAEYVTSWIG